MSECILWTGATSKYGYGAVKIGGKTCRAHRVAWEEKNGPIPKGMMVLHRCDVRNCINVEHLFLGTAADNSSDMVKKGRQRNGERHGQAKLTEDQVRQIRAHAGTQRHVAWIYGVSQTMVGKIKRREVWRHVK